MRHFISKMPVSLLIPSSFEETSKSSTFKLSLSYFFVILLIFVLFPFSTHKIHDLIFSVPMHGKQWLSICKEAKFQTAVKN